MDNLWLKVENIVEKGEIARFEQFLLFSLCFKKLSIWGKGLTHFDVSAADNLWKHYEQFIFMPHPILQLPLQHTPFENIVAKEEIAQISTFANVQYLYFHASKLLHVEKGDCRKGWNNYIFIDFP